MDELSTALGAIGSRLDAIDGRLERIEAQMVPGPLCAQRGSEMTRRLNSCETRLDEAQRLLLGARGGWSAVAVLGACVAAVAGLGLTAWATLRPAPAPTTIAVPVAVPHLIPIAPDAAMPAPRKGRR